MSPLGRNDVPVDPDASREFAANANVYLISARAVRDFGDGFIAIMLPVYLTALDHSPARIGLIATAALLGSSLLTIIIGLIGARQDHRRLLLAAAGMMIATGIAFALVDEFAILMVIAFVGTANPSAGNVSVFVPLEHTVLTRQIADHRRTRLFARYSFVGAMAAAVGSPAAAAPEYVAGAGFDQLIALQAMFLVYGGLGVVGAALYARIPKLPPAPKRTPKAALGPSRNIVYKLAGSVQPRCALKRLCRAITAGAVAVRPVRHVAYHCRIVLLLGRCRLGVLLPSGSVDC